MWSSRHMQPGLVRRSRTEAALRVSTLPRRFLQTGQRRSAGKQRSLPRMSPHRLPRVMRSAEGFLPDMCWSRAGGKREVSQSSSPPERGGERVSVRGAHLVVGGGGQHHHYEHGHERVAAALYGGRVPRRRGGEPPPWRPHDRRRHAACASPSRAVSPKNGRPSPRDPHPHLATPPLHVRPPPTPPRPPHHAVAIDIDTAHGAAA